MVKQLEELCLTYIYRHFKAYPRLGGRLRSKHKAMLLERMCWHEMFIPDLLPSITYHLFSDTLKWINLSHSSQITDKTLETLSTCQCQPTSITINDCINVTDKGIESLSHLTILVKVEVLVLSKLKNVTGEGLTPLRARSLKELTLKDCSKLKDHGVIQMIRNCPNVTHLDISWSYKLTDSTVVAAAETLQENLVEIHCSEVTTITSESTLALAKWCPNIQKASFDSCVKLTGQGLLKLAQSCSIKSLKISFCYKLPPSDLDILITTLHAKNSLTKLEIMGNTLGNLGVEFISTCNTLTHLLVSGVNEITDENLELICKELGNKLVEIDISTCTKLTDKACDCIAQYTRSLEKLGMRNLNGFIGMGLSPLFQDPERAEKIKSITFSGSKTISPLLVMLITNNCPYLKVLLLAGVKQITDDIVVSLAHNCPNLIRCSLRNCDLTDYSVCELSMYCNRLQMLALAGIHCLTDKCVISLADNCPHIKELYLSGCAKITTASLTYLKDCVIKAVWIQHAVPNAPPGLLMAKDLDTGEYKRMDSSPDLLDNN